MNEVVQRGLTLLAPPEPGEDDSAELVVLRELVGAVQELSALISAMMSMLAAPRIRIPVRDDAGRIIEVRDEIV